jgi:hypothetical protein
VDDAGAGRDDLHVVERLLAPAQEGVALGVALELEADVLAERLRRAVDVDLHRVVDDQVGGLERVDLVGIEPELGEGVAHRGEVAHRRDAGEVLHQHAGRAQLHLVVLALGRVPRRDRGDVGALTVLPSS